MKSKDKIDEIRAQDAPEDMEIDQITPTGWNLNEITTAAADITVQQSVNAKNLLVDGMESDYQEIFERKSES